MNTSDNEIQISFNESGNQGPAGSLEEACPSPVDGRDPSSPEVENGATGLGDLGQEPIKTQDP